MVVSVVQLAVRGSHKYTYITPPYYPHIQASLLQVVHEQQSELPLFSLSYTNYPGAYSNGVYTSASLSLSTLLSPSYCIPRLSLRVSLCLLCRWLISAFSEFHIRNALYAIALLLFLAYFTSVTDSVHSLTLTDLNLDFLWLKGNECIFIYSFLLYPVRLSSGS